MMSHFLGEEAFKDGLTAYLNKFKYSNARQDDLWNCLNNQAHSNNSLPAHISVQRVMDTWTLQTGYPVITVKRDYSSKTATITQQRFLLSGNDDGFRDGTDVTWWVPLTYTSSSDIDFEDTQPKLWLENEHQMTVDGMPGMSEWVLFNIRETGYYRVNYDEPNWRLLMAAFPLLPDTSQTQLIDDALNLAVGGYLKYDIALDLSSCMKDNIEFLPWMTAVKNLEFIDQMLAFTDVYDHFKTFMLSTLDKVYEQVQYEKRQADTGSQIEILNQVNIMKAACRYGHQQCVANAKEKFQQWMNQGDTSIKPNDWISPNLKEVIYCTAIGHGSNEEWDFAWQQYQHSKLGSEKEELLEALGCSQNPETLGSYLEKILSNSSGIRKQDGVRVFGGVARNMVGHSIAFDFLRDNWEELQSFYGGGFSLISNMVRSIGIFMNTPNQLAELEEFRGENSGQLGTTERSLNQTIERVQINVNWMENNYKEVEEWLKNYKTDTTKQTNLQTKTTD